MGWHKWSPAAEIVVVLVLVVALAGPLQAADSEAASSKTWIGRESEIEQYLKTVEPVAVEPIGDGVTNPFRAELEPGGPVPAFAWKPIKPGVYSGFHESYKAEVAAYELDKLLELGMVPVTVERRLDREHGAACMWIEGASTFKALGGVPKPPTALQSRWNIQILRAKMFDNLIGNRDPNLGNWLVDSAWNVILIDHTRSLTPSQEMPHELKRVDAGLWGRMQELDEAALAAALGDWLDGKEIRSILKRRDKMARIIDKLVAKNGERSILLRYDEPIR